MLTVVEKVVFLQNVEIFGEVPSEQLTSLAAIADETEFQAGDTIFKEKEPSDSLYLVITGKVSLQRDGQQVLLAGPRDSFGTWSLLDEEPQVVTAKVMEDTMLLRIDRNDFVDLLADNIQVTQSILKTLVKRLRELIKKLGPESKRPV